MVSCISNALFNDSIFYRLVCGDRPSQSTPHFIDMARLAALLALGTSLLASATVLPAEIDSRASALNIAQIINLLGIGLVTKIDAFITVSLQASPFIFMKC